MSTHAQLRWDDIPPAILEQREAADGKPAVSYRSAGDRFILVEYGPTEFDMNLNFFTQSVIDAIVEHPVPGVVETAPGFRSIVFSLDGSVHVSDVIRELDEIHTSIPALSELVLPSRVIRLPAAFDDSASRVAVERYVKSIRDDAVNCAGGNNIDYTLAYNGVADLRALVDHVISTDLWVGFLGFFPGLPFMLPLDPRHVLFAPKYNPTRTWTQEGAIGLGGPAYSIYPVESPGGYQLLGRTIPVYDVRQRNRAFAQSPVLLRPSDRIRFYEVEEAQLLEHFDEVHADAFRYRIEEEPFDVGAYQRWSESLRSEAEGWRTSRDAAAAMTPVP